MIAHHSSIIDGLCNHGTARSHTSCSLTHHPSKAAPHILRIMSEQKSLDGVAPSSSIERAIMSASPPSSPLSDAPSQRETSPSTDLSTAEKSNLPLSEKDTNLQHSQASVTDGKSTGVTTTIPTTSDSGGAVKMAMKRKLTQAEKDAQEKEREAKKQKKADEAQVKEAAKAAKAVEKAKAAAEKAKADAEKEAKRAAKAAEKAEVDAKKEAIRKQKEEQEQALQRKKAKQQNMLAAFVKRPPSTPVKPSTVPEPLATTPADSVASPAATKDKPVKAELTPYEKMFIKFYVKPGVTWAAPPFAMDDDTKAAKSAILDEFIFQKRDPVNVCPFNPTETFQVHGFLGPRGLEHEAVKAIMEATGGVQLKSESQTAGELVGVQRQLDRIPMKVLKFYEDVRPPYFGTVTTPISRSALRKLSRRPIGRNVAVLNYDYDSEAEWQDDEGEDLMSEDEEDDLEGEDELDDFLDDSDDVAPLARPAYLGEAEPVVVGVSYEGQGDASSSSVLGNYKMEFLLGKSIAVTES